MKNKSALSKNLSDIYSPSNYLNQQKFQFNTGKCQYSSYNYNNNCFSCYKNLSCKNYTYTVGGKAYDVSNDYDKKINS